MSDRKKKGKADPAAPPVVERKRLKLTWLDRVVTVQERSQVPAGMTIEAFSALTGDGTLYVLRMEGAAPAPNVPGPLFLHVSFNESGAAGLVAGEGVPIAHGRPPTVAELDEVVYRFARGRVMALMFEGLGIPTGPAFYALVQIAGAVLSAVPAPPGKAS